MSNMRDTVKDPALAGVRQHRRGASGSPSSKKSDVGGEYGLEGVIYEVTADREVTTNKELTPKDHHDIEKANIANDDSKQSSKEPFSFGQAESSKHGGLLREKKQPEVGNAGKYQELNEEDYPAERETEKANFGFRHTFNNKTDEEKINE